jgi:hypothetical protein
VVFSESIGGMKQEKLRVVVVVGGGGIAPRFFFLLLFWLKANKKSLRDAVYT